MPARPRLTLEIFLLSLTGLLLEVSYTRVFSFKLVYYFTYLIIGIALLGVGSGGVLVALLPGLRRTRAERLVPACAVAGATTVLVGYAVVAKLQVNSLDLVREAIALDPAALGEGAKLLAVCLALFAPFLAVGLAVAAILCGDAARVHRLYFADLAGAGLGCALAVPLMTALSPPGCVVLAAAVLAAAGLPLAARTSRAQAAALATLALVALTLALDPPALPDVVTDRVKTMSPQEAPVRLFSRWHPIFRVDVLGNEEEKRRGLMLVHDGMWGSVLPHPDTDPAGLVRYDTNPRAFPFRVLPPHPRVAVVGAAGGNEILAALHFDAAHVVGIELNPVTVGLLTGPYAAYTGGLATDPRVTLVNAEGRSFLMRDDTRYDLVWFVAPDSYAAMNAATSGAYVLSESYLYTQEMIAESLAHLAPGGIVCTQFGEPAFERKPNRTARYLATARAAFAAAGVDDFPRHVLVATTPEFVFLTSTILLKREPFTDAEVAAFRATAAALTGSRIRHAPGEPVGDNPVNRVVSLPPDALRRWYAEYPFDVRPVTDDAPFFWHFVPFRAALARVPPREAGALEEGMGERLLVVLLAIAFLFAAVFLLVPLVAARALWRTVPCKLRAACYFAALGAGFMFLEVSLIQRLTLFLGFPTYSLTVTLCALLVSTGLGATASERAAPRRNRALAALLAALAVLVAFYLLALPALVRHAIAWPLGARIATTATILAPLGLCLGAFLPLGLRTVAALSPHPEAYVAWGWAVNGFCSVVSSVLATLCSMLWGFDAVMLVALAVYAVGVAALASVPTPGGA